MTSLEGVRGPTRLSHPVSLLSPFHILESLPMLDSKGQFIEKYPNLARSLYPRAVWIAGDGRFALVAPCKKNWSITLWEERERAEECKAVIDRMGCGGFCWLNAHYIQDLKPLRRERCRGACMTGKQCQRPSIPGGKLCWQHERILRGATLAA